MPTCAEQFLHYAAHLGIDCIFANLGSDHPAFIEAFASMKASGKKMPDIIVCPHEMTALSAAHGYAMITRRPQLVLVHVDVGTENLGGSVHNAARGRVPAIIVAGLSPVTENCGRVGGRNEFIHDIQDAPRQQEIVSQYMKWAYELRAPEAMEGVLLRAAQVATTEPQGPVYLTGARELWESAASPLRESATDWPRAQLGGLPEEAVRELARSITEAKRPLVITGHLGRRHQAVKRLVELSERVGIGVCEVSPTFMNFPGSHPHHLGYRRNTLVDDADLILLLDVDVPWLKSKVSPNPGTKLFHIDSDPLKTGLGFWHYPAQGIYRADTEEALGQLVEVVGFEPPGRNERLMWIQSNQPPPSTHASVSDGGAITPGELTHAVRELVGEHTIVVFEAPTATELIPSVLRLDRPGSYFGSGGTGLGWGINAALGAKLAAPASEVIALVGDGSYGFGVPTSTYWVAGTYGIPFLTVIYNNGGWNAPQYSTLAVHPEGAAKQNDMFWTTISAGARLADIAAASGAGVAAFKITEKGQLRETLKDAMTIVRSGLPAVVDVQITPFSGQVLGRQQSLSRPRGVL